MLDGRRLNHDAVRQIDGQSIEVVEHDTLAPGECVAHFGRRRARVGDLAVDLTGARVSAVLREQLGQRAVLGAQRGEHVQRREHPGVGPPEVAEVEVTGVLATEHSAGLGHRPLDEGMTDPGTQRHAAALPDDLRHRVRGDQVVNDRGARLTRDRARGDQRGERGRGHDLAALIDDEAAVGIAVERQPDVCAYLAHFAPADRARFAGSIGFASWLGKFPSRVKYNSVSSSGRSVEDRRHGQPAHAVAGVDHDLSTGGCRGSPAPGP